MQDQIPITFTAQQLDIVANALGQRPYIEAAPVIEAISKQVAAYNANGGRPSEPPLPPIDQHPDATPVQ